MNPGARLPRNQHYVPQFLLRNFAVAGSEQLYVFDKQAGRSFKTNVRNVAAEGEFYNITVPGGVLSAETALSELEAGAAEIIRQIIKQASVGFLTTEMHKQLALFIAVQMVRVKQQVHMLTELTETLRHRFGDVPGLPTPGQTERHSRERMVLNLKLANDLAPHLLDKALLLFRSHPKVHLYLSDNPVTMNNARRDPYRGTLGLAVRGIEVYLPICPTLTLAYHCTSHVESWLRSKTQCDLLKSLGTHFPAELRGKDVLFDSIVNAAESGKALDVSESVSRFQNQLQVWNSSRFVFSRQSDFDLVREMIRRYASCKTGPKTTG